MSIWKRVLLFSLRRTKKYVELEFEMSFQIECYFPYFYFNIDTFPKLFLTAATWSWRRENEKLNKHFPVQSQQFGDEDRRYISNRSLDVMLCHLSCLANTEFELYPTSILSFGCFINFCPLGYIWRDIPTVVIFRLKLQISYIIDHYWP